MQTKKVALYQAGKKRQLLYINVKVNTSVTDAESYNIVFDGKKAVELEANGENEQMAEVYTTSIAKHTLKVEAVLASGETVESNERNFFVSKKGIALGEDMSKTVELKKMNLSLERERYHLL